MVCFAADKSWLRPDRANVNLATFTRIVIKEMLMRAPSSVADTSPVSSDGTLKWNPIACWELLLFDFCEMYFRHLLRCLFIYVLVMRVLQRFLFRSMIMMMMYCCIKLTKYDEVVSF